MIGTRIGRYEILEELGHGGMSVVYKGLDTELDRLVAVKVLHDHLAKKADNRERLRREARAIARLRHPNILEIYDYAAQTETRAYIVMEYVDGMNLREFLEEQGPVPAEVAALIGASVCSALGLAHDAGIIHRDIKPENLMISAKGHVKLMDFGIAHVFDAETMTQTGSLLGSPAHMAPETIEGEQVDARADIFALGTVLYWLTTGALPYDGKNAPQVLKRVLEGIYKAPEALDARVGADFGRVIAKCMAFSPEDRYVDAQSARAAMCDFAHELDVLDDDALTAFLLSPEESLPALEASITERLIAAAGDAFDRREIPTACNHINRALGYDPTHPRVTQMLEQMRRGSSRRNLAIGAAAAALLTSAGAFAYQSVTAPEVPEITAEAVGALPPGLATSVDTARSAVAASLSVSIASAAGARKRSLDDARSSAKTIAEGQRDYARALATAASNSRTVAAISLPRLRAPLRVLPIPNPEDLLARPPEIDPEPTTFTYKFDVSPLSATVYIDGDRAGKGALVARGTGFELTAGTHSVRVECPDKLCVPHKSTIDVGGPQRDALPIRLKWRSGTINLTANTPGIAFVSTSSSDEPTIFHLKLPGKSYPFVTPFGLADNGAIPRERIQVTFRRSVQGKIDTESKITRRVTLEPGRVELVEARF